MEASPEHAPGRTPARGSGSALDAGLGEGAREHVVGLRGRREGIVAGSPLRLVVFPEGTLTELMRFPDVERQIRAAVEERLARS